MKTIPQTLPSDMQRVVAELEQCSSQQECVQKAYKILTTKFRGNRLKTLTRFFDLFSYDLDALWSGGGFAHCTKLNWLLKILLIRSGHFSKYDVTFKWTLLWFVSPHQYVQVKMSDGSVINIDIWAHAYGIPFGNHARGFYTMK